MICPECKQYARDLRSLNGNGPYKVCAQCNEKFEYYDKRNMVLVYNKRIEKEIAILLEFLL